MCYLFYLLNIRDLIDNLKPWISDSLDMRKSDVSELGVSSICTCKYLYVHVHVCKGFNESKIVLHCYLLLLW